MYKYDQGKHILKNQNIIRIIVIIKSFSTVLYCTALYCNNIYIYVPIISLQHTVLYCNNRSIYIYIYIYIYILVVV